MKKAIMIICLNMLLFGCLTSKPYTIRTSINEAEGTKTERVCTYKVIIIPGPMAVGMRKYDLTCRDEVSPLSEPTKYITAKEYLAEDQKAAATKEGGPGR